MGWLKEAVKKTADTMTEAGHVVGGIIKNTEEDFRLMTEKFQECAGALQEVQQRSMERAIEYHTLTLRVLWQAGLISGEVIDRIWELIREDVKDDPQPRILKVLRPWDVHTDPRNLETVEVDLQAQLPPERTPYLFVHGMNYNRNMADDFYAEFEKRAEMFLGENKEHYAEYADIYLVSYDTDIRNDYISKMKTAIQTVLNVEPEQDHLLFAALIWREMERRAEETAQRVVLPFLERISETERRGRAVTHSLGCFTMASAAQKFKEKHPDKAPLFSWFCMAAAVPSNAFTRTGMFPDAPSIADPSEGELEFGTSVWFSREDAVLLFAYSLATKHLALGVTGALQPQTVICDYDATEFVRTDHSGYFEKLASLLRDLLRYQEPEPA